MNKWLIPLVILTIIACSGLTACSVVVGTGAVVEKTFDLNDFSNIEISNAIKYEITHSDKYRVSVSAHENIFNYLDVKTRNDTLIVRVKPDMHINSDISTEISLPSLSSVVISGATKGSVKGFDSDRALDIEISGASQMDLDMTAGRTRCDVSGASKLYGALDSQDFRLNLSGASRCELEGSADNSDIEVSGASNLYSLDFETQDCQVNVSGASHARVNCIGNLDIEASGASTVTYTGDPDIKGLNVTGASKVESK